jgi:hypothetical protein
MSGALPERYGPVTALKIAWAAPPGLRTAAGKIYFRTERGAHLT